MAPLTPLDLPSLLILLTPSLLVLLALYTAGAWLLQREDERGGEGEGEGVVRLRKLRVPRGRFWSLVGHLPDLLDPDVTPENHERLTAQYGPTFRTYGFGPWDQRLFTLSPHTAKHVLDHPERFGRPWQARRYVDQAVGEGGLSMAEGEGWRCLRRLLAPVFSKKNLDALAPISILKARQLCEKWKSLMPTAEGEEPFELEVTSWLTRATFDVIGLSGFGYAFNAISTESDALYRAFHTLFRQVEGFSFRQYLGVHFPLLDVYFPDRRVRTIRRERGVIDVTVRGWIEERRKDLGGHFAPTPEKEKAGPKDLLTLMIQQIDDPATQGHGTITDDQVLAQVNTFLLAGSETTALALAWALFYLASHPGIQSSLREECAGVGGEGEGGWGWEEIDALGMLDRVVRETLRLTPPVHSVLRMAMDDEVVPLSHSHSSSAAGGGEKGTEGEGSGQAVRVPRGAFVHVPLEGLNTLKSIWGADAHEFRPERWERERGEGKRLWSFSTGPKACIGMRFALIEIKVFIFHLVREFEFGCRRVIVKRNEMLTRPIVDGENERGQQLPLMISLVPAR